MENDGMIFMDASVGRGYSMSQYREFKDRYREDHAACPRCGATAHSSTYVNYILSLEKADEYKDLNDCICSDCGDRHTTHERVKKVKKMKYRKMHGGMFEYMELDDIDLSTGIIDRNGNEIFANDIVMCKYSDGEIRICQIKFSRTFYQEELDGWDAMTRIGGVTTEGREYTKIGNAHFNKSEIDKIKDLMETTPDTSEELKLRDAKIAEIVIEMQKDQSV